ncbi:hypothetical protein AMK26_31880 [Streptomyces sp. CB03234]|uniref:condensation domain-containing protein n=1 Tax=Streptomyces sp. (strain CB03234) TaxID=1703937 RepID=UPI000939C8F7|nr:condensation domain-containing protein [Streptomyces sp. CB03234]OKJ95176.1 hypothetical protein AMK26_31880 [Streptomyces sp. CB03234]
MNAERPRPGTLDATAVQDLVRAQAADVLGHDPVRASDNFFTLGGDSVRAGRLVMRLTKALPGDGAVDIQDVFGAADFADLAARIDARLRDGAAAASPASGGPRDARATGGYEESMPEHGAGRRPVPLSYGQLRRLQRDADSVGARIPHHVSTSFRIHGPLDPASLEAACLALVERHEALRTVFELDLRHGRHRAYRLDAHQLDLSRLFRVRRLGAEAEVEDEVTAERTALFDLATEAKLRVLVLVTGKDAATVVVTAEHLVCDGDSFAILLRDLAALYNARVTGAPQDAALPQLPPRCWAEEEKRRHHAALEERLAHWRSRLDPLEALPEVRLTGMRDPDVWPTTAAQVHGRLSAATVRRLRETCAAEAATPFCGFVAALALAVLDDAGHTVPGMVSPTSGRPAGWEDDVDWFATSVIHRFRVNTQLTVGDVVRSAKQSVASGLAHSVPLPLLLEHLQFNRDLEQRWRPWLYLAVDAEDGSPLPLHGVDVEPAVADARLALRAGVTVRVDVHDLHHPGNDAVGATVLLQYEREVWPAERAEAFMETFTRMVALVSENPAGIDVATLLRTYRPGPGR